MQNQEAGFSAFEDRDQASRKSMRQRLEEHGEKPRRAFFFLLDHEDIDPDMNLSHDVKVGLVVLNTIEEENALASAAGNQSKAMIELAKVAFRMWDGRKIDIQNGEHEVLWEQMGPKARNVVAMACQKAWSASDRAVVKAAATFQPGTI